MFSIPSSAIVSKISAIATEIKKYNSTIKERKKQDKIVLSIKIKLDSIEVLLSKNLIDLYISHDEFVLLAEYEYIKEKN